MALKTLTLVEAIKTGHKLKRIKDPDWRDIQLTDNKLSLEDLNATDYITVGCVCVTEVTLAKLETIYDKINVSNPSISRPAWREFILELTGIVIK